jgi:hypothetical protein
MILADSGRRTAIVIAAGPKFTSCVRMDAGELTTTRLSLETIDSEGWHPVDYPLDRAVGIYLAHPAGVSDAARRALETVAMDALLG